MRTYENVLNELRANGINKAYESEFYIYTGGKLEPFFNGFFTWTQGILDSPDILAIVNPARVIFANDDEINAGAYVDSGFYIVEINKGTILEIQRLLVNFDKLFMDPEFERIGSFR